MVFVGGPVLTVNPPGQAEALAVRDGKILAVGDRKSVLATAGPNTTVIDLQGHTVMPGFVEPHLHVNTTALGLASLNLLSEQPDKPLSQVLSELRTALPQVPVGGWLVATGFDPSRTMPRFATLDVQALDLISTTVPIFVLNASGHIAYVNTKAFQLAGVSNATPNPPNGEYVKDANGNLTGQLNEPTAYAAFESKFPPSTDAANLAGFRQALQIFSQAGVTSIGDLNTGIAFGLSKEIDYLTILSQEKGTPVRVFCYLAALAIVPNQTLPVQPGQGNDMLRFIGVKFTLDGSTQGFTAALNQPYLNTNQNGTLDYPSNAQLLQDALPLARAGWQLSMHCNGDRALDQALDVYRQVQVAVPASRNHRMRIEHLTVQQESQLDQLRELNLTASLTIGHVFYWGQVFFQDILGPERANRIDPCASLKTRGIRFSLNSDATTTTVEPLRYIENAVTRVPQLNPPQILGPEQRIGVDDAIRAVTLDAAYQLFMDDKIGSLEPGKLADLVILSGNPRTVDPSQLRSIKVLETYLSGQRRL